LITLATEIAANQYSMLSRAIITTDILETEMGHWVMGEMLGK